MNTLVNESSLLSPLFASLTIRSMTVANRFAMAPMTRGRSPGGIPGENVREYYERRAKGGIGLVVTEGIGIDHPTALGYNDYNGKNIPILACDEAVAAWKRVTDAVHAHGGRIAPQLWHQGVMRMPGSPPFPEYGASRPSGIWGVDGGRSTITREFVDQLLVPTEPMSESDIADVIAAYARSASLAKRAGFDAIAIHAAHGYLIDTFFWKETNQRTDRYGGDITGRARFGKEVVAAIRAAIGEDMPIIMRFSQWKQQDFDARIAETPQELEQILGPCADAGVDVFDASTRYFTEPAFDGSPLNLAGWARKVTGKLSMTVGGVGLDRDMRSSYADGRAESADLTPLMERFDREEFDFVAVGRGVIADPDWVNKARAGQDRIPFERTMLRSYP